MNKFLHITADGLAHFDVGALTEAQCQAALDSLVAQRWPFEEALREFALLAKHPVGAGWRFLAPAEQVIAGDEVLCSTGWKTYADSAWGRPKCQGTHARRRLPVAEPVAPTHFSNANFSLRVCL